MLEINAKSDLLLPFERIGDPGWAPNARYILESLAAETNAAMAPPVDEAAVAAAEARLDTRLPESLRLFYLTFGVADVREELLGPGDLSWLFDIWKDDPQYGPDFTEEERALRPYLVVFSEYLGNGNLFCFHTESKEVYYYDHDTRPYVTRLFADAGDYLKGCLLFSQADLFGVGADQDEVESWCEEIAGELFGTEIIAKWMY